MDPGLRRGDGGLALQSQDVLIGPPFVLSLSKDERNCALHLGHLWFDKLTTNGCKDLIRAA